MAGVGEVWDTLKTLRIVRSFHEGMEAEVRVEAMLSDSFEVKNGGVVWLLLCPTSTSVPVVASWRHGCEEAGVMSYSSMGGSWWETEQQSPD